MSHSADKGDLMSALEGRYSVGFSQQITDQVVRLHKREIQFLDIKELNDLAADYRLRLRALILSCRSVRTGTQAHMVRQVYASHESIFIRRQIADLWRVYRMAIADSHEMTADYMAQLDVRRHKPGSLPTEKTIRAAA